MAKRKVKRSPKPQAKKGFSQSDSETDLELPSKRIKTRQSLKSKLSSTPYDKYSSSINIKKNLSFSEIDVLIDNSNPNGNGNCYDDFASFLKSCALNSESENEKESISHNLERENRSKVSSASHTKRKSGASINLPIEDYIDYSEEAIRVISVPQKHLEIVLLQHPATLTLHGHLKVTALFGSASILGYKIKEGKHVKVFSTKRTGFRKVSTIKSMHQITKEVLNKKLCKLNDGEDIEDFMNEVGPASVILLLEQSLLHAQLQFLELYYPSALEVSNCNKKNSKAHLCSMKEMNAVNIHSDDEVVAEAVDEAIIEWKNAESGLRILVFGPKQAGKSSLLRYLVNTVLNKYPTVYYLDTDPGQTEFTPPGVVSITKITKPLLGPPFSHHRKTVKMIFTGSCTAATSPPMYLKSIYSLIEFYTANFPQEILFVNTMGWLQGIGEICLQSIKRALNPSLVIELCPSEVCPEMKLEIVANKVSHIKVPIKEHLNSRSFSAKELRNFTLLSYLGRCQKYYMHPTYINEIRPFSVCWDNIAIYVMGKKMPPNRLIEAVHCSVVALCHVQETLILESEKSEFPMTLLEEPMNECIGFGIVRAADEANHLLYIVTPLTLEELSKVNAIIKGNIMIPDEVYLKQPISQVALPYTDRSRSAPSFARRIVKKRSFRKSNAQTC